MIKSKGIFYENDYYHHIYDMDEKAPRAMAQTHAVVLALDVAKRPIKLAMTARELSDASDEEVEAFRARFDNIDPKDPAPLPLQIYDGDIAVRRTVNNLIAAGVGAVTVIADPSVVDEVRKALESCPGSSSADQTQTALVEGTAQPAQTPIPATQASDPAIQASSPATQASDPAIRASSPATQASDPAIRESSPATQVSDPAAAGGTSAYEPAAGGQTPQIAVVTYDAGAVGALEAESDGIQIELLGRGLILWAADQAKRQFSDQPTSEPSGAEDEKGDQTADAGDGARDQSADAGDEAVDQTADAGDGAGGKTAAAGDGTGGKTADGGNGAGGQSAGAGNEAGGQSADGGAAKAATALPAACDSLLFVHADSVAILPRHFRRMRTTLEEDPSVDFATAFIEWRSGLPLIMPLAFVDRLRAPVTDALPRAQGASQLACRTYRAHHVVMDEDKLFGANPFIVGAQKPGTLPASALATVLAARHTPTDYEARVAKAAGAASNPHVQAAQDFLARLDASLEADPIPGLDEAHRWAAHNRRDFPLLNTRENAGLTYLDAAATSLQPHAVIEAEHEFATHYDANIWRGVYGNSAYATGAYQAAREKVAAFINADPRDVIFTTNTTTSLNLVSQAWAQHNLAAGDLVLVMCNEHHSNMLPWQRTARVTGATVEFIPIEPTGRVDWAAYERLLARHPRLVCAAQTSNVIGLENPIRRMCAAAKEVGAVFVVDAAQSSPHLRIDVQELGIDFLGFSGHKIQGPTGIGVLWAHPDRVREMVPQQIGGGTISEVSYEGTYYRQAPYGFEPGTPPIAQAIALGEAVTYLETIGMGQVESHVRAMTDYALRTASLIPGLHVLGDHTADDGRTGLLSFTFDTLESTQLSMLLGQMGVAVRSGAHCAVHLALALGLPGTTRISFGPYTTRSDIEAWGYAMHVIAGLAQNEVPRS